MTEQIKRPEFGQRITWTAVLVREKETNGRKFWRRHELSEARSGLYNGPRSLKNGKLEDRLERSGFDGENYISAEWVRVFVADEHIPAYLVVANANVNPVYVLPEDCAWEPPISDKRLSEIHDILCRETGFDSHQHSRMNKVVGALRDLWNEVSE